MEIPGSKTLYSVKWGYGMEQTCTTVKVAEMVCEALRVQGHQPAIFVVAENEPVKACFAKLMSGEYSWSL